MWPNNWLEHAEQTARANGPFSTLCSSTCSTLNCKNDDQQAQSLVMTSSYSGK